MRINKKSTKKRSLLLGIILLVVLLFAATSYAYVSKQWPFANDRTIDQTVDNPDIQQDTDSTDDIAPTSQSDSKSPNQPEVATPEKVEGEGKPSSRLTISSITQTEDIVRVRVLIPVYTSIGTCSLNLKGSSGKSSTLTAPVQALSSHSTCAGFDIPKSSLDSSSWTANVSLEHPELAGSDSKEFTLQ